MKQQDRLPVEVALRESRAANHLQRQVIRWELQLAVAQEYLVLMAVHFEKFFVPVHSQDSFCSTDPDLKGAYLLKAQSRSS